MPTPSSASQAATVFDLMARPEAITPPWGFVALFWLVGLVLALIAVLAWRLRWRLWRRLDYTSFALGWWIIVACVSWSEIDSAWVARDAARDGSFHSVEGCLSNFHPGGAGGGRTKVTDEVWTVGGQRFRYGTGDPGFGWHNVEPLGGAVHPDSLVSVAFVRADDRNEILRLIVTQHVCKNAPDPGSV